MNVEKLPREKIEQTKMRVGGDASSSVRAEPLRAFFCISADMEAVESNPARKMTENHPLGCPGNGNNP